MKEIEVKFLDIDKAQIREKLRGLGFEMVKPETLMRRIIYLLGDSAEKRWARLRGEGDKITLTVKDWTAGGDYPREIEINVSDYENTSLLMKEFGLKIWSTQESKSEIWVRRDIEVSIDTWPKILTFIEIESNSEEKIKGVSEELGFDFTKGFFCSVSGVYSHYGLDIDDWRDLKF